MYDDGAHGDYNPGDGIYGAFQNPLPAGSQVAFRTRATDTDGNTYLYPLQRTFQVLDVFAKTTDILFVPDYYGNDTSGFRGRFTDALNAAGFTYDTWDTGLRGELHTGVPQPLFR